MIRSTRTMAAVAVAVAVGGLAGCGGGGGGPAASADTEVDAIFENASFAGPGQDVRIAGGKVGSVKSVELTPGRRARVRMSIDAKYLPFRADAECSVLPQSLIGERFVDCSPGTPAKALLAKDGEGRPTVGYRRTHSPVDLDLVIAMLGQPANARLQLLLNEIGAGTAARGEDIDRAVRRANPALQQVDDTLDVLNANRSALRRTIDASDRVLGELDQNRGQLARFVTSGGRFLKVTSDNRPELEATLDRIAPALRRLRPALMELRAVSRDATPTVDALTDAAPDVTALADQLGPLTSDTRPALRELRRVSAQGPATFRRTLPQFRRFNGALRSLTPALPVAERVTTSLRDNGAVENIGLFAYNGALALSRYDEVGHIVPAHLVITRCMLQPATPIDDRECQGRFADEAKATARKAGR